MRIESSNIQLSSQRVAIQEEVTKESLKAWVGARRPNFEGGSSGVSSPPPVDSVELSQAARSSQATQKAATAAFEADPEKDPKLRLIQLIIEKLTGKKMKLLSLKDLGGDVKHVELPEAAQAGQAQAQQQRQGWGVEYDYYHRLYEAEKTTFNATGVIKTADGKEISFNLDLAMSREFLSEQNISLRAGDAAMKDPLVINFDGTAAQLMGVKFAFDIDADGSQDQISFVAPNSGFLALDKNGDGTINDGGELFGASSGNGFAELAAYDEDHNNWIDENDWIYTKLLVWSKNAQGQDNLVGLQQSGVGAIYLGNVGTQFDVKDAQNQLLGQVKSSGIYVNENGSVGTVQQVDLAV